MSADGAVRLADGAHDRRPTRSCSRPAISGRRRRAASIPRRSARSGSTIPGPAGFADGLGRGDVVLLLGTGLTAVDVALTLDATGFRGRIVALSRRGLAPRAHGPREPMVAPREDLPPACAAMLRRVRARTDEIGWRERGPRIAHGDPGALGRGEPRRARAASCAICGPGGTSTATSSRPRSARRSRRCRREARLAVAAGKLVSAERRGRPAAVRFRAARQRGGRDSAGGADRQLHRARSSTSSAPASPCSTPCSPPAGSGRIRCGSASTSTRIAGRSARTARPARRLSVIGPVTRGTFWESVAVPDIAARPSGSRRG